MSEWGSAGTGAASGAAAGAAAGSIVPGFGTLIGAGIGAIAGGVGGFLSGRGQSKRDAAIRRARKKAEKAAADRAAGLDRSGDEVAAAGGTHHTATRQDQLGRIAALPANEGAQLNGLTASYGAVPVAAAGGDPTYASGVNAQAQARANAALAPEALGTARGTLAGRQAVADTQFDTRAIQRGGALRAAREKASVDVATLQARYERAMAEAERMGYRANRTGSGSILAGGTLTGLVPAAALGAAALTSRQPSPAQDNWV